MWVLAFASEPPHLGLDVVQRVPAARRPVNLVSPVAPGLRQLVHRHVGVHVHGLKCIEQSVRSSPKAYVASRNYPQEEPLDLCRIGR